jgi:hypothetical protein
VNVFSKLIAVSLVALAAGCAKHVEAPKAIAVIGVAECGKWMGAIVVDPSGALHPSNSITAEQAVAIANTLPPANSTVADAPCVSQGTGT